MRARAPTVARDHSSWRAHRQSAFRSRAHGGGHPWSRRAKTQLEHMRSSDGASSP